MLSFAFRNPDQSVTSYNKAVGGHSNVAKGNQLCEMRGRYIGVWRRNRNLDQGGELLGRQQHRRMGCHSELTLKLADQRHFEAIWLFGFDLRQTSCSVMSRGQGRAAHPQNNDLSQ
jgi:hypothetical protein